MTFTNPNPECEREDCTFESHGMSTTCMYFPPIYDKHGNNTNPDKNTTTERLKCLTCKRKWLVSKCYGTKPEIKEI